MKRLLFVLLFCTFSTVNAFSWRNLWTTPDQHAKTLMDKGDFVSAQETFERSDWQAAAAYRAEDYQQAATLYKGFKSEDASYNQGNALAHLGQYEQALKAYDKTLAINPNHSDALYNRKIIEKLIKKNKQNQDKQDQNKQDQNKQDQNKQNQNKQNQDKQNQDKQNQDKQDQDKQNQDKQNQDKQDQDKQDQDKSDKSDKPSEDEQQKAKEKWLRLVPDDPGGLMREKFMRDHLRRQRGWDQ